MALPVSNDLRREIVIHKQNNVQEEDIAKWLKTDVIPRRCSVTGRLFRA